MCRHVEEIRETFIHDPAQSDISLFCSREIRGTQGDGIAVTPDHCFIAFADGYFYFRHSGSGFEQLPQQETKT